VRRVRHLRGHATAAFPPRPVRSRHHERSVISVSTSTRPRLVAEPRTITGKKVSILRREGKVPAVVYGHGHESQPVQIDAHELELLRRHTGRNALLDLTLGKGKPTPVILQHIQEHPVTRKPVHVDLFVVDVREDITIDVPISFTGESDAVRKDGGTLLHQRETVSVRALPDALPSAIEVDISSLVDFEATIHVSDMIVPEGVTILPDAGEVIARVQAPRVAEEPVTAAEAPEAVEAPAESDETPSEG
jgi:large subunit ribosomal protein L25